MSPRPEGASRRSTRPVPPRRGVALLVVCLVPLVAGCNNATIGENAVEFSRLYCANWATCHPSEFAAAYKSQEECRVDWRRAVVAGSQESSESKGGSVPVCLALMKADACYLPSSYSKPPLRDDSRPPVPNVAACSDLFE
ncbi:MAG: hypothetical protein IT374_11775 [Polyangiaceae bacterium]|nr:hypothetical protein [Polyangiaceae bacterium]